MSSDSTGVFEKLGFSGFYPQKLTFRDAIQIRGNAKEVRPEQYPFLMLQKIMAFDSHSRFRLNSGSRKAQSDSSDSDSDDEIDSVHPMDCLLALIYCSDNILRQDLFCRLATCQIAVPLLLPHLETKDPTLLMWAMRSIVKEFKLQDGTTYSGRIITHPTNVVSFIRLGHHRMSKSELLNGVMNKGDPNNKNTPFFSYTFPGGSSSKMLLNGVVEISWYLPGNGLFPNPIAFTNLRGDPTESDYQKQIDFLCEIATIHVVLVSDELLKVGNRRRHRVIDLLKRFSSAPGGVIMVPTTEHKKEVKKAFGENSKISIIQFESSSTVLTKKIQERLQIKIFKHPLLFSTEILFHEVAHRCCIAIDEHESDCLRGKELMTKFYADIKKIHKNQSPKSLLPLQGEKHWHNWAAMNKEQYRQKNKHEQDRKRLESGIQILSVKEYSDEMRKIMIQIRQGQYNEAERMKPLMKLFIGIIKKENKKVLSYFLIWLKLKLDDLSRDMLSPLYKRIREKRDELNKYQQQRNESAERRCHEDLKALEQELLNSSFGLEHLLREVAQFYEAVAEFENVNSPSCVVKYLPQKVAELLFDGFALELLDGEASHFPHIWVSAVLEKLAVILKKNARNPNIYVVSILGIQSTGKSTLLNTVFGVQFSVGAGRCTRGAFMQLIPIHPSLHRKTGVQYLLIIDTEGLRAPELDRLVSREHDNELATFVIGISNLTLINIDGEVSGEMDDVLSIAVHSFLRMGELKLNPSTHIIHQHVAAIGAEEKLMQARLKTKDKLDTMTNAAAKDSGLESKHFNDVIQFNHKTDVSEFVDLWSGELPMARVSSGYSERAQKLKLNVVEQIKLPAHSTSYSIEVFSSNICKLWNAILQENFVFTFRNTFDIIAFKTLDETYAEIARGFIRRMGELQLAAERELFCSSLDNLKNILKKHQSIMHEDAMKRYKEYHDIILKLIEEDEVMLMWKQEVELRLQQLYDELKSNAEKDCLVMYNARRDCAEVYEYKQTLTRMIETDVQELVQESGRTMLEIDLIALFNPMWSKWINNVDFKSLDKPNPQNFIELQMKQFFQRLFVNKYKEAK